MIRHQGRAFCRTCFTTTTLHQSSLHQSKSKLCRLIIILKTTKDGLSSSTTRRWLIVLGTFLFFGVTTLATCFQTTLSVRLRILSKAFRTRQEILMENTSQNSPPLSSIYKAFRLKIINSRWSQETFGGMITKSLQMLTGQVTFLHIQRSSARSCSFQTLFRVRHK